MIAVRAPIFWRARNEGHLDLTVKGETGETKMADLTADEQLYGLLGHILSRALLMSNPGAA
jgi:hypothetical protein